jgi:hypothetical protein
MLVLAGGCMNVCIWVKAVKGTAYCSPKKISGIVLRQIQAHI